MFLTILFKSSRIHLLIQVDDLLYMSFKFLQVSDNPAIRLRHAYFPCKNQTEEDKARTILVIPGWLDSIEARMSLIQAFQTFANVVVYEPRGFGQSSAPRKKHIWGTEQFLNDFTAIVKEYNLKDNNFYIWGSCLGSAIAFKYVLNKKGPKPLALLTAGPESKFKTKWWFNVLKVFPFFLLRIAQRIVTFFLKVYLKIKQPEETKNIDYAVGRFSESNLFVQLRILIEFIHKYDIRGKEEHLDLPILIFTAEKDWFTRPENSAKFVEFNPQSSHIEFAGDHRVVRDYPEKIAEHVKDFVLKIEYNS